MSTELSDNQILSLSVKELATAISQGTITSVKVLNVFRKRAEVVHAACNVVTYWMDDDAMTWAQQADDYLKSTGKVLGPLHGVPCSLKDHVSVKGYAVTMGLENLKKRAEERPSKYNSALFIALREAGAIPFCKTNMTQLGDTWGGGCPAFGDSLNPWDTLRTTGGSSSGEGGLVGGGASPFGIGSDVGGSVRIPGTFCGICALRPTAKRLTFNWETGRTILNKDGDYGILAVPGPMAKSVEDLVEVCSVLWTEHMFKFDPAVPPMPLNRAILEQTQPLRIGWYIDEFLYPKACPAAVRAVEMAKDALKAAGHTLVPFRANSEKIVTKWDLRVCDHAMMALDNKAGAKKEANAENKIVGSYGGGSLKGERIHPDLEAMYSSPPADFPMPAEARTSMPRTSTPGLYQAAVGRRDRMRDAWWKYWRDLQLDVLLCPAWPFPALPVEQVRNAHRSGVDSCRIFNFLDCPAGVLPVTKVTAKDLEQSYDLGPCDKLMAEAAKSSVDNSLGLPIAVQVVAPPWREEMCLRGMLEVQRCLPFDTTQHAKLSPVPRRSPDLGEMPEIIKAASKL